jgi:hypothetical protein
MNSGKKSKGNITVKTRHPIQKHLPLSNFSLTTGDGMMYLFTYGLARECMKPSRSSRFNSNRHLTGHFHLKPKNAGNLWLVMPLGKNVKD